MSSLGFIIILMALLPLGFSVYGLFNRQPSWLCLLAGLMVLLWSCPAAIHAWGEVRSIPFTTAYAMMALLGLGTSIRQFRLFRQ